MVTFNNLPTNTTYRAAGCLWQKLDAGRSLCVRGHADDVGMVFYTRGDAAVVPVQ